MRRNEFGCCRCRLSSFGIGPLENVAERANAGKSRGRDLLDLQILAEGKRRQLDGLPAPDARLNFFRRKWNRGPSYSDATMLVEIDLVFQPGLPVTGVLNLVQQQILRRLSRDAQLFPSLEQSRQPDEFDEGTVKSGLPNVFGIDAVFDERVSGLPEERGFPDLPRTAHQIVKPAANLHRDLAAGLVEKRVGGRANARR